ncbi:MAG TPA: phosphotransferase family protein [Ktedonobacterales bacterium]|jgi:aminoglycoside phosphotransferase (APT) family kinase protein
MPLEETIPVRADEAFNIQAVETYLRSHLTEIGAGALVVRQFPAGASNLTYLLQIGAWEGVLRRPPLGPVPPRAHDMGRECRLLQRTNPVFPLAPKPYFFCDDLSVIGAPFYVMERRRGVVLNDRFPPEVQPTEARCAGISQAVVKTLAQIHTIDWQAAGLGDLGYPEGFLARQVRRWIEAYSRAQTDDIPLVEPLTRWLADHIPAEQAPALIHNDFKLNNMLLSGDDLTTPTAVLDWEMATIGDPLLDLAITLSYWVSSHDPEDLRTMLPTVTNLPGFISREDFMERYAHKTGRDLSAMPFYLTFAYFRMVVIIQQIYARWKRGQTQDQRFAAFGDRVRAVVAHAAQRAGLVS